MDKIIILRLMNYYPMFWRLHRNLILSVNHFTTKSKGCWTILWFMILFKPIQRTDFTAPARKVQSWAWHIATQYTGQNKAKTLITTFATSKTKGKSRFCWINVGIVTHLLASLNVIHFVFIDFWIIYKVLEWCWIFFWCSSK